MKKNVFINFFIYTFIATTLLGIIIYVYAYISDLEIDSLSRNLYIGFVLYMSIGFGILGYLYAHPSSLTISNPNISITDLEGKLDHKKYIVSSRTSTSSIWTPNWFNRWFYGDIVINKNEDKIQINAAKCIIDKYYKEYIK